MKITEINDLLINLNKLFNNNVAIGVAARIHRSMGARLSKYLGANYLNLSFCFGAL